MRTLPRYYKRKKYSFHLEWDIDLEWDMETDSNVVVDRVLNEVIILVLPFLGGKFRSPCLLTK